MVQNKLVYIIVLNFNAYKDTIDCIKSIFKSTYLNYKVIIVDNYSDDGSVTKLYDANGWFSPKRKTYLIDPNGVIVKVYEKVDISTHTKDIIDFLSN